MSTVRRECRRDRYLPSMSVQTARAVFTAFNTPETVAAFGEHPIEPLPDGKRAGEVQRRRKPPERRQPAGEVANLRRAAMPVALLVDDVHVRHQGFVR